MKSMPVWIVFVSVLVLVVTTGCQSPQSGTGFSLPGGNNGREQLFQTTPGQTIQSTSTIMTEQVSTTCVNGICESIVVSQEITTICIDGTCENYTEASVSR
ncbi:MAG TPA: hypothetical protein VLH40_03355 [Atribacteraceae bacterium]|nr:hypothetical protein [Atribacteraceae bacterium]